MIYGIVTNGENNSAINYIHIPSLIIMIGGALFSVMITVDFLEGYIDGILENELFHKKRNIGYQCFFFNAGDRNRTGTVFPQQDFKSCASASSATPAYIR